MKATIDPVLALELRVRWLEALTLGPNGPSSNLDASTSAVSTSALDKKVQGSDEKKRGNLRGMRGKPMEKPKEKLKEKEGGKETAVTLARLTENVKKRLDTIVEANEGLRKFMDTCMSSFLLPLVFLNLSIR